MGSRRNLKAPRRSSSNLFIINKLAIQAQLPLEFVAEASENLRTHADHVTAIADAVLANAREAADVARQLQSTVSIRRAAPLVAQLRLLAYQITEGHDLDGDGQLSFDGEAGMQQLEAHLYLLLEGEGLARELH